MDTIDLRDRSREGAPRAHSTPEPDDAPDSPAVPIPEDVPDPAHAPVEEPSRREVPIREPRGG